MTFFNKFGGAALVPWGLALLVGLGAGLSSAQTVEVWAPVRKRHSPEKALVEKALARTIAFAGIDDPKTTLDAALNQLSRKHKVRFLINDVAFQAEEVKKVWETKVAADRAIEPGKMTLSTVLRKILVNIPSRSGAIFVPRHGEIEITTRAAWLREVGLCPETKGPLVLERFQKVPLRKALEIIASETGAVVVIDVRVEKKARVKVTAYLYHVPVETAIELLADMGSLAVVQQNYVYYVTSPANAARLTRKGTFVKLSAGPSAVMGDWHRENGLQAPLPRKVPLNQALETVAETCLGTVLLDSRAQKKARVKVPLQKVLDGAPVETALELLTDMAGLAVVKKANVYYVTSRANAARLARTAVPVKPCPKGPVDPEGM